MYSKSAVKTAHTPVQFGVWWWPFPGLAQDKDRGQTRTALLLAGCGFHSFIWVLSLSSVLVWLFHFILMFPMNVQKTWHCCYAKGWFLMCVVSPSGLCPFWEWACVSLSCSSPLGIMLLWPWSSQAASTNTSSTEGKSHFECSDCLSYFFTEILPQGQLRYLYRKDSNKTFRFH